MALIQAQSIRELLATLANIDISVPLRTEGRTTEHCERWSICRFLAAFSESGLLAYPLEVFHEDKPDFVMSCGGIQCGVEVTEAIAQNAAAIDAIRKHHDVEGPFFLQHHHPKEPKLKGKQLLSRATSTEAGDGWAGDSVEKEWVEAMRHTIQVKVQTSNKPDFRAFQRNWLLIYDGWQLPALHREAATKMLLCSLCKEDFGQFEYVFIDSGPEIWALAPGHLSSEQIIELWQSS